MKHTDAGSTRVLTHACILFANRKLTSLDFLVSDMPSPPPAAAVTSALRTLASSSPTNSSLAAPTVVDTANPTVPEVGGEALGVQNSSSSSPAAPSRCPPSPSRLSKSSTLAEAAPASPDREQRS